MLRITDGQFDQVLLEILSEMRAESIIRIPGVYEAVSEELNNQVLDRIEAQKQISENPDWCEDS